MSEVGVPSGRQRRWLALLGLGLVPALLLAGCGAGDQSAASSAACQKVSAVLSDGPDPGADPVGYAEAQPRQLRQIRTSDAKVHAAIDRLANAYEAYYLADGKGAARQQLRQASHAMDAVCPGATP